MPLSSFRAGVRRIFLRLLRWRIQARQLTGVHLGILVLVLFAISLSLAWHHFGTEFCLPLLADATPILLAIVGIIMSYIQPKKENHRLTTAVLIIAGIVGSGILSLNRVESDKAHKKETAELNHRMDLVNDQNTSILQMVAKSNAPNQAHPLSEADREQDVLRLLKNKYILTHKEIDPEVLSGNRMPPADWLNAQLKGMHESFSVKANEQRPDIAPQVVRETPKAHLVFSFYQPDLHADQPKTVILDPMDNNTATVSISAIVSGDVPAEDLHIWIRRCITCKWGQTQPGFVSPDEDHEYDRLLSISRLEPNVGPGKWTFTVQLPAYMKYDRIAFAAYYACDNCETVNWAEPQRLWVARTLQAASQSTVYPSISSAPGRQPVKKTL